MRSKGFPLYRCSSSHTRVMMKLYTGRGCTISALDKTPKDGPMHCHNSPPHPTMLSLSMSHVAFLCLRKRKSNCLKEMKGSSWPDSHTGEARVCNAYSAQQPLPKAPAICPQDPPETPGRICSRERLRQALESRAGKEAKAGDSISSAPWEMRRVSSESCFPPNRCKKRSLRRSEINAALTLFCICKRTWVKKDSECACIHSTFSCQTRGPRYGHETDTEGNVCEQ